MLEKIKEMFILQNKLNIETNGQDWCMGVTKDGKIINWERAITLELAECIDSYPWKHWKSISQQPDIKNAKIELVDVWHFLMSSLIETNEYTLHLSDFLTDLNSKEIKQIKETQEIFQTNKNKPNNNLNLNFQFIVDTFNNFNHIPAIYEEYEQEWTLETHQRINHVLQIVEETLAASALSNKYKMQMTLEPDLENIKDSLEMSQRLLIAFIGACGSLNLSFEELYSLYIGKNVLNQFRQDNGYKEGTYIKMWNGEEDNVIMQDKMKELGDTVTFDTLYNELNNVYSTLK